MKLSLSLGSFAALHVASLVILIVLPTVCQAQQSIDNAPGTASLGEYSLAQRGLDFKVWQGYTYWTDESGEVITNNQSYTELATGMSYLENGQLVDSVQEIDAVAGGFQATQGHHQVQFAANANANTPNGAVTLTMPDNSQMVSTVYGLAYWDQSSGSNVLIAPLQDSMGALAASNELVYPNAFQGVTADLQYVYRIDGLSQNVLIKSLPSPSAYGLIPESTVLQVITTFLSTPEPDKTTVNRNGENFDDLLNFGPMFISMGQAVLLQGNGGSQPAGIVGKHWLRTNQTDYLIEELPYSAVSNMSPPQASNIRPGFGPVWRTASLKPLNPGGRVSRQAQTTPPLRVPHSRVIDTALAARLARERYALVDYDIVSGTTNITFQGDTTYYISANVNLVGTNTFEGGTVLKYAGNSSIAMLTGTTNGINWMASAYLPVILTAKDNDNVGAMLTNSTHTPVGYYASNALSFAGGGSSPAISHFVIQYAATAISTPSGNISLSDGQIVNCSNGIVTSSSTVTMGNLLFANVPTALNNNGSSGNVDWHAYNITFGGYTNGTLLLGATGSVSRFFFTNCILANLNQFFNPGTGGTLSASYGANNGFYNNGPSSFGANPIPTNVSPFQVVGAGSYYLNVTNGSSFIGAGTTNTSQTVLEDIQDKTVYPPNTTYTNKAISTNVTFSTPVQRDNGPSPSLGYHYDPIDYACSISLNGATLTIDPGIVVAGAGSTYAIKLNAGCSNYCAGNATNMVYLMRYTTVQEQSNTNWESAWSAFFYPNSGSGTALNVQFAVLMALSTEDFFYCASGDVVSPLTFENCQIYNAPFYTDTASPSFTNCLFRRPYFILTDDSGRGESNQFYNCLFYYGQMTNFHKMPTAWIFDDNLFDHTVITNTSTNAPAEANNGYVTNSVFSMLTTNKGLYDVILSNSPNYELGPLGTNYYPTNYYPASGTNLIYAGSRLASAAGLSLYTVTTNDVPDYTNNVSIGFHYSTPFATPPYFTQQPTNTIASYSNSSTLTVTAADGGAPLSYQWQFDGVNITGATSSSYTVPNVMGQNLGNYSVTVTDGYTLTTSSNATLQILPSSVAVWGDLTMGEGNVPSTLTNAVSIVTGDAFCLALRSDGTVVGWGDNTYGQISNLTNLANVVAIAAGEFHGLALFKNGTVTNWGTFSDGGGVYNNVMNYAIPSTATNVVAIAAGACQDLALLSNGTVVEWSGTNQDNPTAAFIPASVPPSPNYGIKSIACGWYNNLAILANGSVTAWGAAGYTNIPSDLTNAGAGVTAIGAYRRQNLALKSTGSVESWGASTYTPPSGLSNVASIAQGSLVSLAVTSNGAVVAWGQDIETNVPMGVSNVIQAAAGLGTALALVGEHYVPQMPQILYTSPATPGLEWVTTNTTLVVDETNYPNYPIGYQWRSNGVPITTSASSNLILGVFSNGFPQYSIEANYTVDITNAAGAASVTWDVRVAFPGMIAAWGSDAFSECNRPPLTNFIAAAAGEYHSVGLMEDGTVTNWGQFWDGSMFHPLTGPATNSNFIAVAAGAEHDIGLLNSGTVVTWGTTSAPANWVPVGLSNVTAIACGWNHNVALLTNGSVVAWGVNLPYANLTNVPPGLADVTAIAAGPLHSLALSNNGTVAAWGYSPYGETNVPANLANIVAIAAGGQHNLVLSNNGTVYAWGNNASGQCNVPAALTNGSSNAVAIAAGWAHSVALLNNGTVVSWGDNSFGETNVPSELQYAAGKSIAAGGYHTLETIFSPHMQYPVNIRNDLLLIYNTNCADSITVLNYYHSHPIEG